MVVAGLARSPPQPASRPPGRAPPVPLVHAHPHRRGGSYAGRSSFDHDVAGVVDACARRLVGDRDRELALDRAAVVGRPPSPCRSARRRARSGPCRCRPPPGSRARRCPCCRRARAARRRRCRSARPRRRRSARRRGRPRLAGVASFGKPFSRIHTGRFGSARPGLIGAHRERAAGLHVAGVDRDREVGDLLVAGVLDLEPQVPGLGQPLVGREFRRRNLDGEIAGGLVASWRSLSPPQAASATASAAMTATASARVRPSGLLPQSAGNIPPLGVSSRRLPFG